MVSRILISIALLCNSFAMSQEESALKFNQVLLVELTEEAIVVPESKVWKMVSHVSTLPSGTSEQATTILINNSPLELNKYTFYYSGGPAVSSNSNNVLPMWLPSGTLIGPLIENGRVSHVNIIEFNTN